MNKRTVVFLLSLVVSFVLVVGTVFWMYPLSDAVLVDNGDDGSKWVTAVHDDILQAEYTVSRQSTPQPGSFSAVYQAPNRENQFRTYFTPDGITLMPREAQTPAWTWGLRLVAGGDQSFVVVATAH